MQDVPTPQNDFCDPVLLARTLSVLTSVDSIHIKFAEHLFRNWPYVPQWRTSLKTDAIQNQNIATRAYTSILMGAEAASLSFTTLRMERMPVSCFVSPLEKHQDSPFNHLATMTRAVRNVHTLDVRFSGAWVGAIQKPDGVVAGNVAAFLISMPLRSLTLEWCDGTCNIDGPLGFYIRHSGSVPLNLASPFYNLRLQHLTTLRLPNLDPQTYATSTLHHFLSRHSSTLRRLHLGTMPFRGEGYWFHKRESRCVWKRTLLVLKDTLQLTKFELLVQGDDMLRIYDNEWNEISGRENADAKQLEKLVLGIQGETRVSSRDQHRRLLTPHCV
ncbi:uncharacterized protein RSE6_08838 [Rhynchosporium secalis]|uniref:F-box domain-containing protein n=1 Tax=Rhynchosporium secalis TaxID=38038 RepID=A0A1E1MHI6_RHYSE|nr:uncharacterized protein RSE6_08838 [Rhynchosporium secalis]